MGGFEQVAWFPLCAGLTAIGLVASWILWRRRGTASGLRMAAWSLLPLAAYLTGVVGVLWDVGTTIATWAIGVVISPLVWAGIALAGVSVVAFVVSGVLRSRRTESAPATENTPDKTATGVSSREVGAGSRRSSGLGDMAGADDEDFSDVEEILRKRGIS